MPLSPTDQEQQFLESMREMDTQPEDYRVVIERTQGVWDVTLSSGWLRMKQGGVDVIARGTGATFQAAWGNMAPIHQ
jgi:hypothetical protein